MNARAEIDLHNRQIHENALRWERKPVLREVYRDFYRRIAASLTRTAPGLTVEVGSGLGKIKEVLPDCITTDLFPNPWLDRTESAYQLSFETATVANLILFDVWHHLEFPGVALREFHRVLAPGGRLILFEPAAGLLGRLIYGRFHDEPLALEEPLRWEESPPPDFGVRYYAAQGNAWRLFHDSEYQKELYAWKTISVSYPLALAYAGSGGFAGPQLYPRFLLGAIKAVDAVLSRAPALFALRMLVVLERRA
jgi:SAM-dependent methyltransferase